MQPHPQCSQVVVLFSLAIVAYTIDVTILLKLFLLTSSKFGQLQLVMKPGDLGLSQMEKCLG